MIAETTPTSSGYVSEEGESDGEEEDVVMVEDYSALEEEGVTGLRDGKYTYREVACVCVCVCVCAQSVTELILY